MSVDHKIGSIWRVKGSITTAQDQKIVRGARESKIWTKSNINDYAGRTQFNVFPGERYMIFSRPWKWWRTDHDPQRKKIGEYIMMIGPNSAIIHVVPADLNRTFVRII